MKISREWAMPNKWTFQIKPIAKLIGEEMNGGNWVDPFAGESKLVSITNDLNPKMDTDYHMEALEFLKTLKNASADGVLYDPPYSPRQIKECYEGIGMETKGRGNITQVDFWSKVEDEIARVVKPGGKVLSFGWSSQGIGKKRGFKITRIMLVAHGGHHNDTIVTVEKKVQGVLV